jgi:hypothetical protein
MRFVPALKMLADARIDDVRPIIMQSVANNEFHPEFCTKICQNLIQLQQEAQSVADREAIKISAR